MKLPGSAVGITDLNKYLECPRRFAYGMQRHVTGRDPQEDGMTSTYPATAYGSAFHDAVHLVEAEVLSDEEAVSRVIGMYGRWLEPSDRRRLIEDLRVYHKRDIVGVETVLAEGEIKVPLLEYRGQQVWFRAKIDRLYRMLGNPNVYVHKDYKTSRWAKSEEEVHNDRQMWAYNWAIYEWIEQEFLTRPARLRQVYDQLRYGEVPTLKNDEQRAEMHAWLCDIAKAVIDDEVLPHRYNEWCAYCPILVGCPVVDELSDYALSRIAALAPEKPKLKKDGTPGKQKVTELDPDFFEAAIAELPKVKDAMKVLKKVDELITAELKEMPDEKRESFGYTLKDQTRVYWPEDAQRRILLELEDHAPSLVTLTQTSVERELGDEPALQEWVMDLSEKKEIDPRLVPLRD